MSKSRIKIKENAIQTREEMDALVGEIALLLTQEQDIKARHARAKIRIDTLYAAKLSPITSALKGKLALAQDWAQKNTEAFGKARSIEMTHGRVGWRKGNHALALLNRSWNWKKVLETLQAIGAKYVRLAPEVNKELLISESDILGAEQLAKYGVKVTQADDFFVATGIETTEPTLKEAA